MKWPQHLCAQVGESSLNDIYCEGKRRRRRRRRRDRCSRREEEEDEELSGSNDKTWEISFGSIIFKNQIIWGFSTLFFPNPICIKFFSSKKRNSFAARKFSFFKTLESPVFVSRIKLVQNKKKAIVVEEISNTKPLTLAKQKRTNCIYVR